MGRYHIASGRLSKLQNRPVSQVGPAAIPAIVYALARIPKLRVAAGSALAALGVLALWPMHMDRPYRTGDTSLVTWMQKWAGFSDGMI